MTSKNVPGRFAVQAIVGLVAGVTIAAVDNFAFEGEVSPIVIIAMLFAVSAAAGMKWGWRSWLSVVIAWLCVPLAHLVKYIIGLPDTIHPNTYASILMLAAFTGAIVTIGIGSGALLRSMATSSEKTD